MAEAKTPRAPWVYHPFLFAAFPIISLLSSNAGTAPIDEAYGPLAISLGTVAALYWTLRVPIRNKQKLGVLLSLAIIGFFGYGVALDTLRGLLHSREMLSAGQIAAVAATAVLAAACLVYLILRARRSFVTVTLTMNRMALAAVTIACASTVYGKATMRSYAPETAWKPPVIAPAHPIDSENDPDIYFVILDSYARADVLKSTYGYDNSAFIEELKKRGFFVADQGVSNYCFTILCLASTLNMNYVDPEFVVPVHKFEAELLPLSDMVRYSAVASFLKKRGYTFVSFATGATATEIHNADLYLSPGFVITEFSKALIDLTPIRSVLNRASPKTYFELHRERILFTLDQLEKLRRTRGPLFVMAHIIAPHPAHVFDADGNLPVQQVGLNELQFNDEGMDPLNDRRPLVDFRTGYCDSVTYLNMRVLRIIDAVRQRSPEAVFIIQGDHGPRRSLANPEFRLSDEADFEPYVADMSHIFSAYGLPGVDTTKAFWPGITPVNSFRVVMNAYFGTALPMLDGYTHLTTPNEPDKLITLGPFTR